MYVFQINKEVYPRQKIRNKWLVAYTLVRNPSLVGLRGINLKVEEPTIQSKSDEEPTIQSKSDDSEDDDLSPLVKNAVL